MKKIILSLLILIATTASAQVKINFAQQNYSRATVYDSWEQSPFRTGQLKGHLATTNNPFPHTAVPSTVMGIQVSRHASNLFGLRIDLDKPLPLSPTPQYVHAFLHKPIDGRTMLIALGRRAERTGQSTEAEQAWVLSEQPMAAEEWNDAVFALRGANGVEIYSLVVVPQCESPHRLTKDFAAYVGNIEVNSSAKPRIVVDIANNKTDHAHKDCFISSNSRNGDILAADGSPLERHEAKPAQDFKTKAAPSRGFRCAGIRIVCTSNKALDPLLVMARTADQTEFIIPARMMHGEVVVEGLFEEIIN